MNFYTKMNDRQLVTIAKKSSSDAKKACEVLFKRYENQIHKNWLRLEAQLDHSDVIRSLKEDYYDEAYEAFLIAIQKVDLDRIENDDWKLVGMINWYLTNVRTKLIKLALKSAKIKSINSMSAANNGEECMTADPDVEEAYWNTQGYKNEPSYLCDVNERELRCKNALLFCKNKWSDEENKIFTLLESGLNRVEISRKLNINANKVYSTVNRMKEDLKKYLFA